MNRMHFRLRGMIVVCLVALASFRSAWSQPAADGDAASESHDVQSIAQQVRPSLVVFHVADRDGRNDRGIGTGFIVSRDGLVATNLHVIGEGRPFSVELADGRKARVIAVHAADRQLDLAVVRIEPESGELTPLTLADSDALEDGAPIVVMGNPFGLKYSVVSGVLSGRREVDGRQMLQLAVPIEPGNSGGPVVDLEGRVHGVVTMKSAITANLGFAAESQQLQSLLAKPNPVPIERWVTIGALDPRQWKTLFGAQWTKRGGLIRVTGMGEGFGGRALCLWQTSPPETPFELAVSVKLDDEAGAAGLVFHADESQRHYGFYPSNGKLRLSCFEGPSVFQWRVLREEPSAAYRPGQWNDLRISVNAGHIQCFVNGEAVFEVQDDTLQSGNVGLAKFRETQAEFRHFQVGKTIEARSITPEDLAQLDEWIAELPPRAQLLPETLEPFMAQGAANSHVLEERARELERKANDLREAAREVRLLMVLEQLEALLDQEDFSLLKAALLIAQLDDSDLDAEAYVAEVDRMAEEIRKALPAEATSADRLAALNRYLFEQNGFHGSRHEYYHRANSYLNRVIDDREGLPITLSLLYMELAQRIDLKMEGVGLSGHFVVRWVPETGEPQLLDVFNAAKVLTRDDAAKIVQDFATTPLDDEHLAAVTPRQILQRMLSNLIGVAQRDSDPQALRRYLEAIVILDPDSVQHHGMRALARFENGYRAAAIADLDWLLQREPAGLDLQRIREMRDYFERSPPE